jgi:LmbE family N-acetylglucosaminyl deacetylase
MIKLEPGAGGGRNVLALGAHCDDIEIGCGATMLRLAADPSNAITWVVFSSDSERAAEATRSMRAFLGEAENRKIIIHEFRDGFLPWVGAEVKDAFEALKGEANPDLVFTHYRDDLHQDHRLVSDLTWNTFRDHLVLEYEIPKWDGDFGQPNAFVEVSEEKCARKCEILLDCYPTQAGKPWFSEDLFRAVARIRGMECRAPGLLAEAFYVRKIGLSL